MSEKGRTYSADELLQRCKELSQVVQDRQALLKRLTGTSERAEHVKEKVAASQYRALEKGVIFLAELLSQEIPEPASVSSALKKGKNTRQEEVYIFLKNYAAEHPEQPITLTEIGRTFGFSKQRASQIYHLLEADNMTLPPLFKRVSRERRSVAQDLLKKDTDQNTVAEVTGLSSEQVENEIKKLQASGDLFDAEAERKKVLERQVLHLRQDLRMGNNAIAAQLAVSRVKVRDVLEVLSKRGEDVRLRAKRRTARELDEFDEKVNELYEKGMRNREIAALLGEKDKYRVINSLARQRKKGFLTTTSQGKQRMEAVKQLRLEGWSNEEISQELAISKNAVNRLVHQLLKRGEVIRVKKAGRKRDDAFYNEVEKLKKDGRSNAEIAAVLDKSYNQVLHVVRQLYKLDRLTKD